ncbi:MAG TPA: hypothetical protein VN285_11770 [Candidatus Deferrimicrobium sp.]|nr:hypothetical protein [Candidatus Deferrimicrobium sp.]
MANDRDYAHSWLQSLIGWIVGLIDLISRIFSGGCYISSAVVAFKGLDDSSPQMRLLRQLREEYIFSGGVAARLHDLDKYYVIGAVLSKWVESRADSSEIWEYVWQYVQETADLVQSGRLEEAYSLFKLRTLRLRWDILRGLHKPILEYPLR